MFSTVDLVVVLQDVNDNPPRFLPHIYKIKVAEDLPLGALLLWVESVDSDLGGGGLVTYNLKNTEGGSFRLDSSTGALTLERELDFERRRSYNLTVRAVDHGLPRSLSSSCFVEIEVLDVNENLHRPLFSEFVYEAAVLEDAAVGTSVLKLTASDKDVGTDGAFRYHIHDGSGLGVFTIDGETGKRRRCPSGWHPWSGREPNREEQFELARSLARSLALHRSQTRRTLALTRARPSRPAGSDTLIQPSLAPSPAFVL